jgi:hypothetical protein
VSKKDPEQRKEDGIQSDQCFEWNKNDDEQPLKDLPSKVLPETGS